jgi:hypothetical protein
MLSTANTPGVIRPAVSASNQRVVKTSEQPLLKNLTANEGLMSSSHYPARRLCHFVFLAGVVQPGFLFFLLGGTWWTWGTSSP